MRGGGLSVAAVVLAACAARAGAATFGVTKTFDTHDGRCDADCSLREAVAAANAAPGADRISLPAAGVYALARAGAFEDASATGDLDITDALIIAGTGAADTVIDAGGLDRAVHVLNAALELADLTVRNGATSSVQNGAGVAAFGGGLSLTRVEVADNTGGGAGGGVYAGASDLTITDSTVAGNRAGRGGGLYFQGLTRQLAVRGSTVSGNRADQAGGVFVDLECGFADPCTLAGTTIADNVGTDGAGGLQCLAPHGSLTLATTLLAGNAGGNCAPSSALSAGYNLSDDGSCGLAGPGDRSGLAGGHGPLRWNGGPTRTHALLDGSAAIDGGDPAACPPGDQRGRARQGPCDIGAFEATRGPCGDLFVDLGEACEAGAVGTDGDCCLGACAAAPPDTECADDGDPCTRDACDATARCGHAAALAPACRAAARSQLVVRADGSVLWSWLHGAATPAAELGQPQSPSGTAYALCVYAGVTPQSGWAAGPAREFRRLPPAIGHTAWGSSKSSGQTLVRVRVPPSPDGWRATARQSLHYKDASALPGARKLLLRPGGARRSRAQVMAVVPAPTLSGVAAPIVVQLRNEVPGACWESHFEADDVRRNDTRELRAIAVR
jgi:CSLREA domain-containing protein